MATARELKSREQYSGLMVEAKARAMSVNRLIADQRDIPSPLVREYCFLQLRMLCEIIALGCLVAHGDLVHKGPKTLPKAYAPGEIFSALEQLHDDFYPVPMTPQKTADGWHFAEYQGGPYLQKQELPRLWATCGGILHRGSLKKLIATNNPVQNHFADVAEAGQKIFNLLSAHRIVTVDRRLAMITFLQVDDLGGAVQVALGETLPPAADESESGAAGSECVDAPPKNDGVMTT